MIINYQRLVEEENNVKRAAVIREENLLSALNSIFVQLSESLSVPDGYVDFGNGISREYLNVSRIDSNGFTDFTAVNRLKTNDKHVLDFALSLFIDTVSGGTELIHAPVKMWFEGRELVVSAGRYRTNSVRVIPDNSPGCYSPVLDLLKSALLQELQDVHLN